MMGQICDHIHNYFEDPDDIRSGSWTIAGGTINLPFLVSGQYFRVVGSALNDGVYQYPATGLLDETFEGQIWPMRVPKAVRDLAVEIAAWQDKYGARAASPFVSENVIGVYSYTRATGGGSEAAGACAWQWQFKSRLNQWRRLY